MKMIKEKNLSKSNFDDAALLIKKKHFQQTVSDIKNLKIKYQKIIISFISFHIEQFDHSQTFSKIKSFYNFYFFLHFDYISHFIQNFFFIKFDFLHFNINFILNLK